MTTAITAWAIKAPDGNIIARTVHDHLSASKVAAMLMSNDTNHQWERFEARGYRCVRVMVQEMQE